MPAYRGTSLIRNCFFLGGGTGGPSREEAKRCSHQQRKPCHHPSQPQPIQHSMLRWRFTWTDPWSVKVDLKSEISRCGSYVTVGAGRPGAATSSANPAITPASPSQVSIISSSLLLSSLELSTGGPSREEAERCGHQQRKPCHHPSQPQPSQHFMHPFH